MNKRLGVSLDYLGLRGAIESTPANHIARNFHAYSVKWKNCRAVIGENVAPETTDKRVYVLQSITRNGRIQRAFDSLTDLTLRDDLKNLYEQTRDRVVRFYDMMRKRRNRKIILALAPYITE